MAAKDDAEMIIGTKVAQDSVYTLWVKVSSKSLCLAPFLRFLHFTQNFKMTTTIGRKKTIFGKQLHMSLHVPYGSKISSKSLYLTISEINMFLHFHHCKIQKKAITHLAIEVHL